MTSLLSGTLQHLAMMYVNKDEYSDAEDKQRLTLTQHIGWPAFVAMFAGCRDCPVRLNPLALSVLTWLGALW